MLAAGTRIGRFRVVAPLGAGGMGEVYLGRDDELARDVAIKVLPDAVARDAEAVARFRREATAVARLSHPNVVVVYDLVEGGGAPAIAMERLRGQSVRERMREGPVGLELALRVARGVLAALDAAHAVSVVHRDVKPANVFLTERGAVKLLDFGVARLTDATRMTATGELLGTTRYLAPELLAGAEASPASDLYATGVMLYELLAGRPPFDATGIELVLAIRDGIPRDLAEVAPATPPDVAAVVMRAIARDPAARPSSAAEMLRALGAPPEPVEDAALDVVAPAPARRATRSLRAPLALLGALVAAAAVGATAAVVARRAPTVSRRVEVRVLAEAPRSAEPDDVPAPPTSVTSATAAPSAADTSSPPARRPYRLIRRSSGITTQDPDPRIDYGRLVHPLEPRFQRCLDRGPEPLPERFEVQVGSHRPARLLVQPSRWGPVETCLEAVAKTLDTTLPGEWEVSQLYEIDRRPPK